MAYEMVFSSYLMQALQGQVVGREYAVAALVRAVTLALANRRYSDSSRPLATLLFAGPTGSGKMHVAQALARVLLGNECKSIYVNCQILGQQPNPQPQSGLYEQLMAGSALSQMTPPFTQSPLSVVVFEKIELAPPAFRDYLAAAIDRGVLCALGCMFSLRDTFIILTSDLSKKQTDQLAGRNIGFISDEETDQEAPRQNLVVLEEIDNLLGAALVNRIERDSGLRPAQRAERHHAAGALAGRIRSEADRVGHRLQDRGGGENVSAQKLPGRHDAQGAPAQARGQKLPRVPDLRPNAVRAIDPGHGGGGHTRGAEEFSQLPGHGPVLRLVDKCSAAPAVPRP